MDVKQGVSAGYVGKGGERREEYGESVGNEQSRATRRSAGRGIDVARNVEEYVAGVRRESAGKVSRRFVRAGRSRRTRTQQ